MSNRDRLIAVSLSVLIHATLFFGATRAFIQPAKFGMTVGDTELSVGLESIGTSVARTAQHSIPFAAQPSLEKISDPTEKLQPIAVQSSSEQVQNTSSETASAGHSSANSSGRIQVAQPHYLENPAPSYPDLAKRRGQQGRVILLVLVDKHGHPTEVSIKKSSGYSLLDTAAMSAVKHWVFEPATTAGIPVDFEADVPIRFQLD